ncbi:hemerythrin domain-containing protein [Candidatus Magnetaquicoccus inordinatus]|uniref:hemerythrin domain-containing protein n=1 Tax=Candidatus Magnetaquicoccus inordinatus TaxID=2496818 RepID=UPI00102AB59A|nr:hemerythrin domain-containing protein [Candidatus Magnetaquicoccus inordinatus]
MESIERELIVELLLRQHREIEEILERLVSHFREDSWQGIGLRTAGDFTALKDLLISHLEQEQKLLFAWVLRHGTHNQQLVYQGFWQSGLELARSIHYFFKSWQWSECRDRDVEGFIHDLQELAQSLAERIHTEERLLYPTFAHDSYISPLFLQEGLPEQPDAERLHRLTLEAISYCLCNEEIAQFEWASTETPISWVEQTELLDE